MFEKRNIVEITCFLVSSEGVYRIVNDKKYEEQRYGRNKDTVINATYINSGDYRRKFDRITDLPELNRLLYKLSKKMLKHRSGTRYEDMYWIDPINLVIVAEEIQCSREESVIYSEEVAAKIKRYERLITLHSHPNSFPPSINDLNSNFFNHYDVGIVVCHDGKVFIYSSRQAINENYYLLTVEGYLRIGYNEYEAQIETLKDLQTKFDIMVEEVRNDNV